MQVAPEQGPLLAFVLRLMDARRVLELGTFTGYSALAMALALPPQGRIVTCDISEEWTAIARRFWDKGGVTGKIELRLGPAVDTLRRLEAEGGAGSFDFAFIDANKEDNDGYYESALRLIRRGGVVAVDNAFRGGRVADPAQDFVGVAEVRALNTKIAADERVDRVLIPIADGMTLVRRR
jgi:predicted O-methyltransferase YrrM